MPDQFAEQIIKLQALRHREDPAALEEFDEETEQLMIQRFGDATNHLEAYELAMMGEAETIVNMQQAAQEDATQDLFHKGLEQRRQVIEGCLADLAETFTHPETRPAAPAPAKILKPKAAKKPRAVKKKAPKKKAGAARRAAKKSVKRKPAKSKKPAAARKKKFAPARKKKARRK